MATAGSIVVDLLMRTGSFETDTDRASKKVKKLGKDSSDTAAQMGAAFGKIAGTVAGGLTVATVAVAKWTRQLVDASTELGKLSQLSGTSDQVFQRMAAGAATVGIQQEKLADIFKDTQDKLGDFYSTGGGAMKDFFDQIAPKVNLTAESFRNLSGPDVLQKYYKALEDAGASQADMVFYMEAIASDSAMLAPLLAKNGEGFRKWGDEAIRAGAVLDGPTLKAMKEVKEQSNQMDLAFQGLKVQIATELLPQFTSLVQLLGSEETKNSFKTIASLSASLAGELANGVVQIANLINRQRELNGLTNGNMSVKDVSDDTLRARAVSLDGQIGNAKRLADGAWLKSNRDQSSKILEDLRRQRKEVVEELNNRQRSLDAAASFKGVTSSVDSTATKVTPGTLRTTPVTSGESDAEKAAKRLMESLKSANDQLRQQIELYDDASQMSRFAYEIQNGGLRGIDKSAQAALLSSASLLDMLGNIDEAQEIMAEDAQKFADAFKGMFGIADDEIGEAGSVFGEFSAAADQAARNMQDAFSEFLFDPFKDGVGGMAKAFTETLQKIIAEAASAKIFELLGGWAQGYSGAGSKWINAFGGLLGGKRAGGGPVAAGGLYEVGEGNRSELLSMGGKSFLIPGNDGSVTPITAGMRADEGAMYSVRGGDTNHFNFNVNGSMSDRERQMMEQAVIRAVAASKREVAADLARGTGEVSKSMKGGWDTGRRTF